MRAAVTAIVVVLGLAVGCLVGSIAFHPRTLPPTPPAVDLNETRYLELEKRVRSLEQASAARHIAFPKPDPTPNEGEQYEKALTALKTKLNEFRRINAEITSPPSRTE